MADRMVHAVLRGDADSVIQKIADGVDVNAGDYDGLTPLMHASKAEPGDPTMVRTLLENGAKVDLRDRVKGATALHYAAEGKKPEIAGILIDAGADVDAVDLRGNTPLMVCLLSSRRSKETYRVLINGGADEKKRNRFGVTPAEVLVDLSLEAWGSGEGERGESKHSDPGNERVADGDTVFMEHPSGEFSRAIDALADCFRRLSNINPGNYWITISGQGSARVAEIRVRKNTIDCGNKPPDLDGLAEATGVPRKRLKISEGHDGWLAIDDARPEEMAAVVNALLLGHFNIGLYDDEMDYSVGAEW